MFILVAYASCHGSTTGVAERVAARLTGEGHRVDLRPAADVRSVTDYHAAVIGSAIHNGDWLPDAAEILHRHAVLLAARPVWLFSVGMAPALRGRLGRRLAAHAPVPPAVAANLDLLAPRDVHTFAGALERGHIPVAGRLVFRGCGGHFGDFRDWAGIDSWGLDIAEALAAGSLRE